MSRFAPPSKISERLEVDPEKIKWLTRLIRQGEGSHLEFKAKTSFPDKIVKEMIAFANSGGGTLLIGISDDGKISGVKYPEEDSMLMLKALHKYCWPRIKTKSSMIKVSGKKWVVVFDVSESKSKPIRFKESRSKQLTYIRYRDKTLQASREAEGILRLKYSQKAVSFSYGDVENKLLKVIDEKGQASFAELKRLMGINELTLSGKLIQLAAANIIGWKPMDEFDLFLSVGRSV